MTLEEPDIIEDEETEEEEDGADIGETPEDVESSLDELLAKREKTESEASPDATIEEAIPPSSREERVETLTVKVVPQQPTEFTCRNCFLVKHRSQLANKKRMLCRDCA
ncbi:MAG TPA: DUF4193 family protein [Actinomycetota bacterium]|nr:DUF4193 family protein [Actinomycetota bacterium]